MHSMLKTGSIGDVTVTVFLLEDRELSPKCRLELFKFLPRRFPKFAIFPYNLKNSNMTLDKKKKKLSHEIPLTYGNLTLSDT